jgi:hypothetical protein
MAQLSEKSSGILPRAGSMRSGIVFERLTSGRHTVESGSSSWPTATANSATYSNGQREPNLIEAASLWQTPAIFQGKYRRQANQTERTEELLPALAETVSRLWMTPKANEPGRTAITQGRPLDMATHLNTQASNWHTPQGSDYKGPNLSGSGTTSSHSLATNAEVWATPMANDDGHKVTPNSHQAGLIGQSYRFGRPAHQMPKGGEESAQLTRRLNPRFVEWLMGWPIGWTDFAFLGTV